MIVRVSHDKDNPYIVINKHCANNKTLSFKALGIHTYLMSKPDNWRANEAELAKAHDEGMAAIRSGIKELIDSGYISRERVIDPKTKRVTEWEWTVYETPEANPNYSENPDCENQNLDTEEKPDCGFPLLEKPLLENRMLISNELINNNASFLQSSKNESEKSKNKKPSAAQPPLIPASESPPRPLAGKKDSEHQQMFEKVCEIIGWDCKTIDDKSKGQVAQALGILKEAGYTLTELNRFWPELWIKDWRWEKQKDHPTLIQLRQEIGKLRTKNSQAGQTARAFVFDDPDEPEYLKLAKRGIGPRQ